MLRLMLADLCAPMRQLSFCVRSDVPALIASAPPLSLVVSSALSFSVCVPHVLRGKMTPHSKNASYAMHVTPRHARLRTSPPTITELLTSHPLPTHPTLTCCPVLTFLWSKGLRFPIRCLRKTSAPE